MISRHIPSEHSFDNKMILLTKKLPFKNIKLPNIELKEMKRADYKDKFKEEKESINTMMINGMLQYHLCLERYFSKRCPNLKMGFQYATKCFNNQLQLNFNTVNKPFYRYSEFKLDITWNILDSIKNRYSITDEVKQRDVSVGKMSIECTKAVDNKKYIQDILAKARISDSLYERNTQRTILQQLDLCPEMIIYIHTICARLFQNEHLFLICDNPNTTRVIFKSNTAVCSNVPVHKGTYIDCITVATSEENINVLLVSLEDGPGYSRKFEKYATIHMPEDEDEEYSDDEL